MPAMILENGHSQEQTCPWAWLVLAARVNPRVEISTGGLLRIH
jgi:hypothetical protein